MGHLVEEEKKKEPTSNAQTPGEERHWAVGGRSVATVAILAVVFFAMVLLAGLVHQQTVRSELAADAREHARMPVSVTHPEASASQLNMTFPANVQAYIETPIYARTNGYIKRWLVDIGARVQRGQLLAEIETPELDQQLRQAEAAQAQAEANLDLARTTAVRYQELLKQDGVSKQDTDQAVSTLHADEANVKAAIATVNQLKELQSFEKVTAPYAGTITARYIDIGTLIASGTNTLLFRLADTSTLRVYADVPEVGAKDIAIGGAVDLETPGTKGKKFAGRVVRTARAIDPVSRTLLTEIRVPNPKFEIVPGAFGEVTFHLHTSQPVLIIAASSLLFRAQGPQVALAQGDGRVHLQAVQVGRDLGNSVEVVSGLRADDEVVENPSDAITEGALISVQPGKSD
ncbi:MAG: efflux RND transporter periplasmic adaptor subunit [Candidatus Acidiferrum sp.]